MFKKPYNRPQPKQTGEIANLFEYDFVQSWKRTPKCSGCNYEFCVIYTERRPPRRPMILDCLHSLCEKCVFHNRQCAIVCPECNERTCMDRRRAIREKLEFNFHLLGMISYIESQLQIDMTFGSQKLPEKALINDNRFECSECNIQHTNQLCMQCNVPYCTKCFRNVHKSGKVLQRHTLTSIPEQNNLLFNDKSRKKCFKHKKFINQYCFDCKRTICYVCVSEHNSHRVSSIESENKKLLPKIYSLIETVNIIKEQNKQAQKNAKFYQNKYEGHASEVVDNISKYFIHIHATLQKMERNLLMELKTKAMIPMQRTRTAYSMFSTSQETLNEVQTTLQNIAREPPQHFVVNKVIENANQILQKLPCKVTFDNVEEDPFKFCINTQNIQNEIEKCFTLKTKANTLRPKISTYFGSMTDRNDEDETLHNISIDMNSISLNDNKFNNTYDDNSSVRERLYFRDLKSARSTLSIDLPTSNSPISYCGPMNQSLTSQKVLISHIISPEEFYVQPENFAKSYGKLKECNEEASFAITPNYIDIDGIYLIFNTVDKTWYRAKALESSATNSDAFKVLLIDYGHVIEVPKQGFREMSDELKQSPPGAIKCSLYGIQPKHDQWTQDANSIMHDVTSKETVNMLVLKEGSTYLIDIVTTHNKYPTSLRDALLFTGVAKAIPIAADRLKFSTSSFERMKKNILCLSNLPEFFKNSFHEGENFRVKILNVVNPQQIYAAKYDHKEAINQLQSDLNKEYEKRQDKIYYPQLNMPCAVFINDNWYRGKVIQILEKGNCIIWLVDKGISDTVHWKQLRILDDIFLTHNEYAFQCSLTDIEPLQENLYAWTDEATAELKRILKNPTIQIFIHRSKEFRYKVVLHIIKTNYDVNVNALMVKFGHAISTGNESVRIEYPKRSINNSLKSPIKILKKPSSLSDAGVVEASKSKQTKSLYSASRRKIKISYIISPGEFYIQLFDHIPAITKFHEEIQLAQRAANEKRSNDIVNLINDKKSWALNENCLVQTRLHLESNLQWYRGVIVEIEGDDDEDGDGEEVNYKVFLRDHGIKVSNIPKRRLAPISSLFNYACNGAIKCHMACVQPTGGLDTWSCSAVDELRNTVEKYESLTASLQGKRKGNSLPIILWGLKVELSDPLAPNITKWININNTFVNCGLAHLIEKFDLKALNNEELVIEREIIEDKQKSIKDWLDNFLKGIKNFDEMDEKNTENNDSESFIAESLLTTTELSGNLVQWRPVQPIEKTVFTAYPTYVDDNAIIYLHDAERQAFLKSIKEKINNKIPELRPTADDHVWQPGERCLALFHLDNLYYRAVVIKVKTNNIITVQFVDYGNIEECEKKDLRDEIIFSTIPIQSSKYQIDGIVPIEGKKWTTDVLDFIHLKIVGKMCTIRVSPNQENETIKKCSIRFENYDLAQLLIAENYAKHVGVGELKNEIDDKKSNSPFCCDKEENCSSDEEEYEIPHYGDDDDQNDKIMDNDDYKKFFDRLEFKKLSASYYRGSDTDDDENLHDYNDENDDVVELDYTYQSGFWQTKCNELEEDDDKIISSGGAMKDSDKDDNANDDDISSSLKSFNALETSTAKQSNGMNQFQSYKLPLNVKGFYCEVSYIHDSTTLSVCPFLNDSQQQYSEMFRKLQNVASQAPLVTTFELFTPCLALYSVDNLWYRALIRSYFPDTGLVEVLYVDFLNAESLQINHIKKLPKKFLSIPLRNVQVKLYDVKPNPRYRECDILNELSHVINNRKVFVKIIRKSKIPYVILYDSQSEDKCIYDKLVDEKFLLKK